MLNDYKIVKQEDKTDIKIVHNKNEFYLDVNGTKIRGVKKYNIEADAGKIPILKLEILLDEESYNQNLVCKSNF